jgi:hypothetical protein
VVKSYQAHGNLTLHGTARPVTFTLSAERTASGVEVSGSIPVLFATWNIPNPASPAWSHPGPRHPGVPAHLPPVLTGRVPMRPDVPVLTRVPVAVVEAFTPH